MSLDEVIELLTNMYEFAKGQKYIRRPLAWALYHTWEHVDSVERDRYDKAE